MTTQISKTKIIYLSNKKINGLGGVADYQSCIKFFKNCTDQATAQYAAEQVACVATAELGHYLV